MEKNDVTMVTINLTVKRWLAICNKNIHDCIHISTLPHWALDIFATWKRVNDGGEYGLEIPANFNFYVPENVKNKIKIKESLK